MGEGKVGSNHNSEVFVIDTIVIDGRLEKMRVLFQPERSEDRGLENVAV